MATKKKLLRNEAGALTGVIEFTFDDGEVQSFDLANVPEGLHVNLMMHGASQKIGDSYAAASGEADPLAFAKACVKETIAQLYAGEWRATSAGGGPRVTDLAVALSRVTGKTVDEAQAFLDTLDDDGKKAIKGKAKVKAALAVIAAERAAIKAKKLAEAAGGEEKDEEEIVI